MKRFQNRYDAGVRLALMLKDELSLDEIKETILLALPRGGVPIAHEVSKELHIPMDLLFVNRIGAPFNEELAIGAIADGKMLILDEKLMQELNVSQEALHRIIQQEQEELTRRRKQYCRESELPKLQNKNVILIDDGIATGATMQAAVRVVRSQNPKSIWIAVPVAAQDVIAALFPEVDCIISVLQPELLRAVSEWYDDFAEVTDEDVMSLLKKDGHL